MREAIEHVGQGWVDELHRRDIYGKAYGVRQQLCRGECLLQERNGEAVHHAAGFEALNEVAWHDQTVLGMHPAGENFEAVYLATAEVHQWLKVRNKFFPFDSTKQLEFRKLHETSVDKNAIAVMDKAKMLEFIGKGYGKGEVGAIQLSVTALTLPKRLEVPFRMSYLAG